MKAIVLAGGVGSRLRPITIERPKPMITIVNKPTLAHILDLLKRNGITDVIITVQYQAGIIQDYFNDGSTLGMNITYYVEDDPLGTAGGVKGAQSLLDDTFLVISGDAMTDFSLQAVIAYHHKKRAKATLTLHRVPDPLEYGVIVTNAEGYVTQILEKPTWGEVISDTVNTGIYVFEPDVLELIPENEPYDFSMQLFPKMLATGLPLAGYIAEGYWCDIGNISSLREATAALLEGRIAGISLGRHIGGNIWVGDDVQIAPSATLLGPIYLGNSVKIKDNAVIRGPTVIRDYTIVEERTQIDRAIVWRNCYIGKGVELRGATVLRHCSLKAKSVVYEGAVVGDGCIVGEGAVIHPNVKIWSGKEIEPGATIKNSVIWGSQGRRVLFGRYGVTGMVNVDFTPEFSAKLGAAFATSLPKGALVTFNRDPHRAPRMLKRAAIAGLPSAGIRVADLGVQPVPVARYYTRVSDAYAGMHMRLSPFDPMVVNTRFIDANGLNIDKDAQRKIERGFFREDFRRVYMNEIGTIDFATEVRETYTSGFLQAIEGETIRQAGFHIVVDYASAPTIHLLPQILSQLGVNVVALNASLDEAKMSVPYETFRDALKRLQVISQALSANLGVRVDVGGETIFVVDDAGRALSGIDLTAALVELMLYGEPGGSVVLPISLPHIFEQIAARHDGHILRTTVDVQGLMQASMGSGVVMAADGKGNFIFPRFHPGVDGLMAVAKLLELLATQKRMLTEVVSELPPYHLAHAKVYCMWEDKGTIMRQLNQRFEGQLISAVEGLKVMLNKTEWLLILPSQDQPQIEVIAEAGTEEAANHVVEEYVRLIRDLQPRTM